MKFYFTYGKNPETNNHVGGWTEVEARDIVDAKSAYQQVYGNVNFCMLYTERQFNSTAMPKLGNFKTFCHDTIYADAIFGGRR